MQIKMSKDEFCGRFAADQRRRRKARQKVMDDYIRASITRNVHRSAIRYKQDH